MSSAQPRGVAVNHFGFWWPVAVENIRRPQFESGRGYFKGLKTMRLIEVKLPVIEQGAEFQHHIAATIVENLKKHGLYSSRLLYRGFSYKRLPMALKTVSDNPHTLSEYQIWAAPEDDPEYPLWKVVQWSLSKKCRGGFLFRVK